MMNIPQGLWDDTIRRYSALREALESQPTERLQGMVDTYSRMQPFTRIRSLFGSGDMDRLRMGKMILTQRELSQLTKEELRKAGSEVNPVVNFLQSIRNGFGYDPVYSRREIALDLLGERKGKPYFVA